MKSVLAALLLLVPASVGLAARGASVDSLVGRVFAIEDTWAGHELEFRKEGAVIHAIWRILGSGRPVVFEKDYAVDLKSERQCRFVVELEDRKTEVQVDVDDHDQIRLYVNGFRTFVSEIRKSPNQALLPTPMAVTPAAGQPSRRP